MDMNLIKWSKSSKVKLISVFTDNPFHVEFDSADRGSEPAPLHSWYSPEPSYRYHSPESVSSLSDQETKIPFSLDFYITADTSSVLDQYNNYFVTAKEESEWFVLRKTFQSSNIDAVF